MDFWSTTALKRERSGGLRDANRAGFVGGDQPLQLHGDQAGEIIGLIAGDEAADCFGGNGAAAEVVVIFVEIIAAGVRGVGFPIVGGPAIAAGAVEGELRRGAGNSGIKIDAVDPRGDRFGFGGINRDRYIRCRGGGRGADLRGIGAFACGVYGGDDVIVGGAVRHRGVGVVRRGRATLTWS